MRHKDESKFQVIANEIKRFLIKHGRTPTQRELSANVGLGKSAVFSYLKAMKSKGLIEGAGRHIYTDEIKLIPVPIVDSLANNKHIYDDANISDYIFISKKTFGDGEFGIVRAIDDSMLSVNIRQNNHVIIRRQKFADSGQIILAKSDGQYILRRYVYEKEACSAKLVAESPNENFDVIYEFEIRGIALKVIAELNG